MTTRVVVTNMGAAGTRLELGKRVVDVGVGEVEEVVVVEIEVEEADVTKVELTKVSVKDLKE